MSGVGWGCGCAGSACEVGSQRTEAGCALVKKQILSETSYTHPSWGEEPTVILQARLDSGL